MREEVAMPGMSADNQGNQAWGNEAQQVILPQGAVQRKLGPADHD